jgi:ankyrin repeat protein
VCTLLLKHGANVNSQNHQGRTPLWRAAFMDKQACVQLLLEAGGDPRIASSDQQTPLQVRGEVGGR